MKKVGFVCTTIFHYLHFRRIASEFNEKAIFIIYAPKLTTGNRYEKLRDYFEQNNVHYCNYIDIISNQEKVQAVIAPYYFNFFPLIDRDIMRIRILYGYAKDAWNYARWNKEFDLCLVYGSYAERKLSQMVQTVSIGHPRFCSGMDKDDIVIQDIYGERLSVWLTKRFKILYCPTWGELSSVPFFLEIVNQLSEKYDVIIKMHHGNSLNDLFDFNCLNKEEVFLCDEVVDSFDLFGSVDLVISDYSGVIFDAMLAKKKILLLDTEQEYIDTGFANIKKMGNIMKYNEVDILSNGESSLDVIIREVLPHVSIDDNILNAIETALESSIVDYDNILKDLYEYRDNFAPARACTAIYSLINGRTVRRKSDCEHSIFSKNKLINFVELFKGYEYIIWGAGEIGQLFASWLKYQEYDVKAYIDMDLNKQGMFLDGLEIHGYDYNETKNYKIIIAVVTAAEDIVKILERDRLVEGIDFINPFI